MCLTLLLAIDRVVRETSSNNLPNNLLRRTVDMGYRRLIVLDFDRNRLAKGCINDARATVRRGEPARARIKLQKILERTPHCQTRGRVAKIKI